MQDKKQPIKRHLSTELSEYISSMLEETDSSFSDWWEIALKLREAGFKLSDRLEAIQDPIYQSMAETLITRGMDAYNTIISVFINGGIAKHQKTEVDKRIKRIEVVRGYIKHDD